MNNWSDQKFADAGWRWILRDKETRKPLGVTTLAEDAGIWMRARDGDVIALDHLKEPK